MFPQWLNDLRWARNIRRARAFRRRLSFSGRMAFDDAIRPNLGRGEVIAYPDALYHVTINDLCRAMLAGVAQHHTTNP